MRTSWMIAAAVVAGLGLLLGWAWRDGGLRPLRQLSEPATLPAVGR